MPPFLTGLLFGLVFIFSFGPGFFALIQTSVQKGYRRAIFLALGISLSDILYVFLALIGASSLLKDPDTRFWMGIIGTFVLFGYGVFTWFRKPTIQSEEALSEENTRLSGFMYLFKGFVLNGLNPFIVVFWLSIISLAATNYDFSTNEKYYFFAGVLTTILTSDIIKVLVSYRLRQFVTEKRIALINKIVAVVLVAFGFQMIYFLISTYY
ncbi:MAG: LysE family transporter [Cyclobacteriaceae bacterium]